MQHQPLAEFVLLVLKQMKQLPRSEQHRLVFPRRLIWGNAVPSLLGNRLAGALQKGTQLSWPSLAQKTNAL